MARRVQGSRKIEKPSDNVGKGAMVGQWKGLR